MATAMRPSTHSAGHWLLRPAAALSLLAAAILACPPLAAALPPARDLAGDARQMREQRIPLLLFYSRTACDWCERARRDYLEPMAADPANADRVLIRQIDLDRRTAIADFSGKPSTHRDFARGRKIRLTPTIEVVGPAGEPLAEAIVGLRLPDFYGTYIERAVEAARARLQENKP